MKGYWCLALCMFVSCALGFLKLAAAESGKTENQAEDPALQIAEIMPRADRSLILDITQVGQRFVAVGERGHILLSDKQKSWQQVNAVPTRSTLTAVAASGERVLAVGHDGIILLSKDAGLHWTRQRVTPFDSQTNSQHNGVPLLDVIFINAQEGFAIGAYALFLQTTDGGETWRAHDFASMVQAEIKSSESTESTEFDGAEEMDLHLNGIAQTGDGSLFIVAESGAAFRSLDKGNTWQRLQLPYEGSMFGVIGYESQHVMAFGLRGNVFESHDLGNTWVKIDTGVGLSIMGGVGLKDGGAVLVGANGVMLSRSRSGQNLLQQVDAQGGVLSSVVVDPETGDWVISGENGLSRYQVH
jgi:photosystem II stability/assembly factor-like uncharacterized protein